MAGKETTVMRYYGDGTGRDGYVLNDCGGLIPKYINRGPERTFQSGLRQSSADQTSSINRRIILDPRKASQ